MYFNKQTKQVVQTIEVKTRVFERFDIALCRHTFAVAARDYDNVWRTVGLAPDAAGDAGKSYTDDEMSTLMDEETFVYVGKYMDLYTAGRREALASE